MPFKSSRQRKFLFKNKPKVARKFSRHGKKASRPKRKKRY